MASPDLIWQVVKKNNSFLRPGLNGALFSAEKGNLYNKNSFKYSGLANLRTVAIDAAEHAKKIAVGVSLSSAKNARKPAKRVTQVNTRDGRKLIKGVGAQVAKLRPDLKSAAQRRASAVHKSLRAKKALSKKK